jgi:WD domain, G-beta repeat
VTSGEPIHEIVMRNPSDNFTPAYSVAFSPDGKTLASASRLNPIQLFDAASGKLIRAFTAPQEGVYQVAFSPDGKTVATAEGRSVGLWDVARGKLIHVFAGHQDWVHAVAFAPDGKTLASASRDQTVRLWDMATGQAIRTLAGHRGEVEALAFAPDGKTLASASQDTTLLIWDLSEAGGQRGAADLAPRDLQALWDDLPDTDVPRSFRAIDTLIHAPRQSVPFLDERVRPEPAPDAARLKQLVADLDGNQFAVRQRASQDLERLGELAEAALRRILKDQPSVELGKRVDGLLDKLPSVSWSGERLRLWRVIQVLEGIGTPEAQAVLKKLAQGAPASRLTQEARASLQRLVPRR